MLKAVIRGRVVAIVGALGALQLAGCGVQDVFMSSGPAPRVEDCMIMQQATPAKFVCDGKVYTAVQLADIRNGTAAAKP